MPITSRTLSKREVDDLLKDADLVRALYTQYDEDGIWHLVLRGKIKD